VRITLAVYMANMRYTKCKQFGWMPWKERGYLEYCSVDGIILKWILKKQGGKARPEFSSGGLL
jgi:hypothetical protein